MGFSSSSSVKHSTKPSTSHNSSSVYNIIIRVLPSNLNMLFDTYCSGMLVLNQRKHIPCRKYKKMNHPLRWCKCWHQTHSGKVCWNKGHVLKQSDEHPKHSNVFTCCWWFSSDVLGISCMYSCGLCGLWYTVQATVKHRGRMVTFSKPRVKECSRWAEHRVGKTRRTPDVHLAVVWVGAKLWTAWAVKWVWEWNTARCYV